VREPKHSALFMESGLSGSLTATQRGRPAVTSPRPLSRPMAGCGVHGGESQMGLPGRPQARPCQGCPGGARGASSLECVGEHDGRREYWIPGPTCERVARGAARDQSLKANSSPVGVSRYGLTGRALQLLGQALRAEQRQRVCRSLRMKAEKR